MTGTSFGVGSLCQFVADTSLRSLLVLEMFNGEQASKLITLALPFFTSSRIGAREVWHATFMTTLTAESLARMYDTVWGLI